MPILLTNKRFVPKNKSYFALNPLYTFDFSEQLIRAIDKFPLIYCSDLLSVCEIDNKFINTLVKLAEKTIVPTVFIRWCGDFIQGIEILKLHSVVDMKKTKSISTIQTIPTLFTMYRTIHDVKIPISLSTLHLYFEMERNKINAMIHKYYPIVLSMGGTEDYIHSLHIISLLYSICDSIESRVFESSIDDYLSAFLLKIIPFYTTRLIKCQDIFKTISLDLKGNIINRMNLRNSYNKIYRNYIKINSNPFEYLDPPLVHFTLDSKSRYKNPSL